MTRPATWKTSERRLAALLNGRRVPVSGRARGDVPDIEHRWLAIEAKHRKRLPNWLKDAMAQARAAADLSQLPVAVLHEAGGRYDRSLVVLRMDDFQEWFGDKDQPA